MKYAAATDTSIVMILRICKQSAMAAAWMKQNKEGVKWMESYLVSRKSGGFPNGTVLLKPRRGVSDVATNYSPRTQNPVSPVAIATASLACLKAILSSGVHRGVVDSSTYESDDEPADLVGKFYRLATLNFYINTPNLIILICISDLSIILFINRQEVEDKVV